MPEWFEDESFWTEMYPFTFSEKRFEVAAEEVDKIINLVGFQGSSVLDLCCGPGRHAVLLAKKGYSVTAVDKSRFLIGKAVERAKAAGVQIELVQEDMRNFARPAAYDLVLNFFTSFGYFDDREDDLKVLRNVYESLRPTGVCLLEMFSKEWLARNLHRTISSELPDGSLRVQRHEVFDDWSRIRNEWILVKEGRTKVFKFHHTIYSGQELKDGLYQVGFKRVKLFGDLDGNEYGLNAQRLVATAWKE
ncbi:MAG: class I SAM-dependent methyltransferase [Candidatus Binatia bacterium]